MPFDGEKKLEKLDQPKEKKSQPEKKIGKKINLFAKDLDIKFKDNKPLAQTFSDISKDYDQAKIKEYIKNVINKKDVNDLLIKQFQNLKTDSNEYKQAVGMLRTAIDSYFATKETKKEKTIETNEFDFESFVDQIQKIDQSNAPDKKDQIAKLMDQNRDNIRKLQGTTKFESILKKARGSINRQNAYILQVYGSAYMDQSIKIDGIYGTQTETVLRVVQSEGVGGSKVNVYVAEEQKTLFEKYKQGYKVTIEEIKITSVQIKEDNSNLDLSKTVSGSDLVNGNKEIGEFVLNNTDRDMKLEDLQLDNKILEKFLTLAELEKLKKSPEDKQIQTKINQIKKQILDDSNQVIKQEALAGCINIFQKYMDHSTLNGENFINNFNHINIKDDLKLDSQNNFLEIKGYIKGNPVIYRYSLSTGEIFASESLHKNKVKGFDINNSQYDLSESKLPIKLPTIDKLIKDGQGLVNSPDNPISHTDNLANYQADLGDKLSALNEENNPKDELNAGFVEQNMEKNYAMDEFMDIIGPEYKISLQSADSGNSVYKLFDMVWHSLNYYAPSEIRKFREQMQNFKTGILDKYSNPNPADKSNEKEFGQTAFNAIKLNHDKINIKNKDNENSFYAFFYQMIDKTDMTNPRYNVINLDTNNDKQGGVLSFQEALNSFAKPWDKPILATNNKLKETMENIQNTAMFEKIEQGKFTA